ncbi:MAG: hypothetical protein ACK5B9_04900 [Flavobacteriia bacterium]|jgi:hypothetical protein
MKFYVFTLSIVIYASSFGQNNCMPDSIFPNKKVNKYHTIDNGYPDSIIVTGKIVSALRGYCGVICKGGLLKVELTSKPLGFPNDVIYIAIACANLSNQCGKEITLHVNKLYFTNDACYYKNIHNLFDNNDFPFYFATIEFELKRLETSSQFIEE